MMHVPTKVDCWTEIATDRHWKTDKLDDAKICKAFDNHEQQIRLNGKACEGCARSPYK